MGRQGLVRVEVLVMVVTNVPQSEVTQTSDTEAGVTQTRAKHIHGTHSLQQKMKTFW